MPHAFLYRQPITDLMGYEDDDKDNDGDNDIVDVDNLLK